MCHESHEILKQGCEMVVVLLSKKSRVATGAALACLHREKNRTLVSSKSLLHGVHVTLNPNPR
jgi:hypothetical protein